MYDCVIAKTKRQKDGKSDATDKSIGWVEKAFEKDPASSRLSQEQIDSYLNILNQMKPVI
jgi:hypothetical protein